MRGRFVTFEGGEGAGKSTQIERLSGRLRARGIATLLTREPGGSPKAERIRQSVLAGEAKPFGPLGEALMFAAARADHIEATIRPALARGDFVLCDRFMDSTRAYQGHAGGLGGALMDSLERVVVEETRPDLTFVLDVTPEVGCERASRRRHKLGEAADRFEAEDLEFHRRLRAAFLDIAAKAPERCLVIDASADPEEVEAAIWTGVRDRILPLINGSEEAGHR